MGDTHAGTCFCGAVAIEATGAPEEMGYCHCSSCRSHSGAPLSAFILWKQENVRVTKGAALLGRFKKTAMSDRHFCRTRGGHVMVHHPGLDLTHVFSAIVPTVAFKPTVHLHYAEAVLPIRDGLSRCGGRVRRDDVGIASVVGVANLIDCRSNGGSTACPT